MSLALHGSRLLCHRHSTCPRTLHQAQFPPSPLLVPSLLLAPSPLLVPSPLQEPDWHLQAAMLVQEVVTATSPNLPPPNSSRILESILSPLNSLEDEQLARTLLAAGLCQVMGFEMVLLGVPPRWNAFH